MENQNKFIGWTSVALELGFSIAIPIVLFAFVGRLLDRRYDTGAVFLATGILLALISTGIFVGRRLQQMVKRLEK